MPLVDISTSGAALDRHAASGTVKGHFPGLQRQNTVIFKQNDAFCRSPEGKRFMFFFAKRLFR